MRKMHQPNMAELSNSTENLSLEQRYVLRHTPRIEPQGQENLQDSNGNSNENTARYNQNTNNANRFTANRSLSEARNPLLFGHENVVAPPTRNSLKEINSNRSSMDVSTCSYNTLIIHNDESIYGTSTANRSDYPSPPPIIKRERPKSYGEQGMQEITEIPDDYLNQSHVLKHLAKEIKTPTILFRNGGNNNRESTSSVNKKDVKDKLFIDRANKCKSLPDLTKFSLFEADSIDDLLKENATLKQQLLVYCMKVSKTQKLEDEVTNIYRVYEELVQSCERREKLERVARLRLQENLQKVQTLNRALKEQVDVFQTQLLAPSEHQILVAQLFTQNKELLAAKERQDVELAAQQATLQEQRTHIGILDNALNNAQRNIRRLEEELGKKQMYIERLTQLHASNQLKKNERKINLDYDVEFCKEINRSRSSSNNDSKWIEKKTQRMSEPKQVDEQTSKLSLDKAHIQEAERFIAEAKNDKLRPYDLQQYLKGLEARLAEKDALIRILQNQKTSGSSFDSYNLSTDSFGLNSLHYITPNSYHNSSTTSFNAAGGCLLESATSNYTGNTTIGNYNMGNALGPNKNYNQSSSFNEGAINIQNLLTPSSLSTNSSNYLSHFDKNTNYGGGGSSSSTFDNKYGEHIKSQLDEQILSKFETIQRGLCCFPSLNNKKPNQPLLSDEISMLSTNNSEAYLQHLIEQRGDREKSDQDLLNTGKNKTDEIQLLEKQGRCSQKLRNNASGNLMMVTQNVGQNMTDISNIGNSANTILGPRKERGNSMPPPRSALPRPPRNIVKTTSKFNHTLSPPSLKNEYSTLNPKYHPINETSNFCKSDLNFKPKDYGSIKNETSNKFGFKNTTEFSKPNFSTTKDYQRFDEKKNTPLKFSTPSNIKTTFGSRKNITNNNSSSQSNGNCSNRINKNSRDSCNSNESNNSNRSILRNSPMHMKADSCSSNSTLLNVKTTPPKYLYIGDLTSNRYKSSLPVPCTNSYSSSSGGVQQPQQQKNNENRHIGSLSSRSGSENRFRIQF